MLMHLLAKRVSSTLEYFDYKEAFLTHARLFILSRHRNVPSLASLCLKRLEDTMVEAQDAPAEFLFVKNMRELIKYSYHPCCQSSDSPGSWDKPQKAGDRAWKELQKAVCGFLASRKGWLLEVPGSSLIGEEEQLTKDLLTAFINLCIDMDELRMKDEGEPEVLMTEIAESTCEDLGGW